MLGTGNDFAKTIKLLEFKDNAWTQNYEQIVKSIAKGFTIKADLGVIESTYKSDNGVVLRKKAFINETSFGIRYVVYFWNSSYNFFQQWWCHGNSKYPNKLLDFKRLYLPIPKYLETIHLHVCNHVKKFILITLHSNKVVQLESDDGKQQELLNQMIAVSNGQYFGSGMQINPLASVNDGKFHVASFAGIVINN